MKPTRILASLLAGVALTLCAATAAEAQRMSGAVLGFEGGVLRLQQDGGGVVSVRVADNARITVRFPSDLSKIAQGGFLGTTAEPLPDGTLKAVEVHVFAENLRGSGEGHRPMDNRPGSTMTNATVTGIAPAKTADGRNTMTNATVSQMASGEQGRKLTLSYKGGEKTVLVAEGTPVTWMELADRSALANGAHVALMAAPLADGGLGTDRITVGRNGYIPPA